MASFGYVDNCPVCTDEHAQYCEESRPFHFVTITCNECGFYSIPKSGQMPLEEVNELREGDDLEPLSKLPKIDTIFFINSFFPS